MNKVFGYGVGVTIRAEKSSDAVEYYSMSLTERFFNIK